MSTVSQAAHFLTYRGGIEVNFKWDHPITDSSHMGGEGGDILGLLALFGHDVVAPAAVVGATVSTKGVVAYHRVGPKC